MFGRRTKVDSNRSGGSESKKSESVRSKDDKETRAKRETALKRFQENGYDSGFVYHED